MSEPVPERPTPPDDTEGLREQVAAILDDTTGLDAAVWAVVSPVLERQQARAEDLLWKTASEGQRADEAEAEVERLRAALAEAKAAVDAADDEVAQVMAHSDETCSVVAERDALKAAIYDTRIAHIRTAHPSRIIGDDCGECRAFVALGLAMPAKPDDPDELCRRLAALDAPETAGDAETEDRS